MRLRNHLPYPLPFIFLRFATFSCSPKWEEVVVLYMKEWNELGLWGLSYEAKDG